MFWNCYNLVSDEENNEWIVHSNNIFNLYIYI